MNGRKGLSRPAALGLMAAACLLFVLLLRPFGAREPLRMEAAADPERVLEGNNVPDPAAQELLPGEKLNLNTAPARELERLPGIGKTLAQAIVEYREKHGPFRSVEELLQVPGIGEKRLAAIRELVTVG